MKTQEILKLREEAIRLRGQLFKSINSSDTPIADPKPNLIEEVMAEISASAKEEPLGIIASSLASGVIAESLAELIAEIGVNQINQIKSDAGQILHNSFERKTNDILDGVLSLATTTITQALTAKNA